MKLHAFILLMIFALPMYAQSSLKVAFVGDSISAESIKKIGQLLAGTGELRDYSSSGKTILKKGDSSFWLEEEYQQALSWNPDVLIINFGIHDSKPQNWIYSDDFESDYANFIKSFKSLPGNHKRIFTCTPIPVFDEHDGISEGVISDEIIPAIRKVSGSQKVALIDLYMLLSGKRDLFPDGVNPSSECANIIAQEVYGHIK